MSENSERFQRNLATGLLGDGTAEEAKMGVIEGPTGYIINHHSLIAHHFLEVSFLVRLSMWTNPPSLLSVCRECGKIDEFSDRFYSRRPKGR